MASEGVDLKALRDVTGLTAVVTGGGGVLGGAMSSAFAAAGMRVAVLDRDLESGERAVSGIRAEGGEAIAVVCDVLDRAALESATRRVVETYGTVDVLVNGAGGNHPRATTSADLSFFDLDPHAIEAVFGLNLLGTLLACQVVGRIMVQRGRGAIVNIASMNAYRPLTRVVAYSAAKAAVVNFTQWLAVHMAQEYSPRIRVNALAPGFFLTDQNRYLLTDRATGQWTPRGESILAHTPMKRMGAPGDLVGPLLWLVSPAAEFVTGIVVPVDGGFSAFSGV